MIVGYSLNSYFGEWCWKGEQDDFFLGLSSFQSHNWKTLIKVTELKEQKQYIKPQECYESGVGMLPSVTGC